LAEEKRGRKKRPNKNKKPGKNTPNKKPQKNPNPPKDDKPGQKPKEPKDPNLEFRNPSKYNILEEFPEVDQTNAEAIVEFVDNLRKNLQSRSKELIPRYTIKEVDQIPKDFARQAKYSDDDRVPDFDDIISEQGAEDDDSRLTPTMVSEQDFVEGVFYVFGSVKEEVFLENIPVYNEDGSVTWDVKLSIPDTIAVENYKVEYAREE
jgi:hypothetical protein